MDTNDGDAPTIKRLEETVVNRIAAGEVIHRPASALKELVENCLDAKSTKISVTLKSGGLKILQVQDNGCGIRPEDFPILCERFTTSKITSYDDLASISSFGFRGEALASLTHVSHVSITSMTAEAACAWKAHYFDGVLVAPKPGQKAEAKACAGVQGTIIHAEDLFFNVPVRLQALRNASNEYNMCLDVMTKYATHYHKVGFTCKKHGEVKTDVHTTPGQFNTRQDTIRTLYGSTIAKELLTLEATNEDIGCKLTGQVTNGNFSIKKRSFVLFINHRLVESHSIRKCVDAVYAEVLPRHTHPFVYLSIELPPETVDVNVHPTKKEVHFLFEEQTIAFLQEELEKLLQGANRSRTFYVQGLIPGAAAPAPAPEKQRRPFQPAKASASPASSASSSKQGALSSISESSSSSSSSKSSSSEAPLVESHDVDEEVMEPAEKKYVPQKLVRVDSNNPQGRLEAYLQQPNKRTLSNSTTRLDAHKRAKKAPCQLSSVRKLLQAVDHESHAKLTEVFHQHVFVGSADDSFCLIQHKLKLYLVDVPKITEVFFYQRVLAQFSQSRAVRLSSPAPVYAMVMLALDTEEGGWSEEMGAKAEVAQYVRDMLVSKAPMLGEYFGIDISAEGNLTSLPELVQGYTPPMARLPLFLLRLGLEANWSEEQACFRTVAQEVAAMYKVRPGWYVPGQNAHTKKKTGSEGSDDEDEGDGAEPTLSWVTRHILFPCLRVAFSPPRSLATDGSVMQVANLENLYKIFERC